MKIQMWDISSSLNYTLKCFGDLRKRMTPPVNSVTRCNGTFGESGKLMKIICNTVSNIKRLKL